MEILRMNTSCRERPSALVVLDGGERNLFLHGVLHYESLNSDAPVWPHLEPATRRALAEPDETVGMMLDTANPSDSLVLAATKWTVGQSPAVVAHALASGANKLQSTVDTVCDTVLPRLALLTKLVTCLEARSLLIRIEDRLPKA